MGLRTRTVYLTKTFKCQSNLLRNWRLTEKNDCLNWFWSFWHCLSKYQPLTQKTILVPFHAFRLPLCEKWPGFWLHSDNKNVSSVNDLPSHFNTSLYLPLSASLSPNPGSNPLWYQTPYSSVHGFSSQVAEVWVSAKASQSRAGCLTSLSQRHHLWDGERKNTCPTGLNGLLFGHLHSSVVYSSAVYFILYKQLSSWSYKRA